MGHADRAHALFSPSSASRWLYCTASVRMEEGLEDTTSEAAAEGTLAHELCELKLLDYIDKTMTVRKFNSQLRKIKNNELYKPEMDSHTDTYVDYIKNIMLSKDTEPFATVEKKVDLKAYIPNCFGTADCILIYGSTLHVIDFKYGQSPNGRVSATENPQMMLYALGAYDIYKMFYNIEHIKCSIVQPRIPDGITEWDIELQGLLDFCEFVKDKVKEALSTDGVFDPSVDRCKYCKARANCRARADNNIVLKEQTQRKKDTLTLDELGNYISIGEDVDKWLKDIKSYALTQCMDGKEVKGYKAVEGRGSREWSNADEAFKKLETDGVDEEMLYDKVPLSIAKLEKALGVNDFRNLVGDFVVKVPGKPTLVIESDKRPAISNVIKAADVFK